MLKRKTDFVTSTSCSKKLKKLSTWSPFSSFPFDVLKWMKKNANPKMALKLMQICKYFQHIKFPYFVIKCLHGSNDGWRYQSLSWPAHDFSYQNIDINNCQKLLWITSSLHLFDDSNLLLSLIPKIAVCDIKNLYLASQNNITFKEFKILVAGGSATTITLFDTVVKDEHSKMVPLEFIFECLPNVYLFEIQINSNSIVSHQQATNKVSSKLQFFEIRNVTENFGIEECLDFIRINPHISFTVYLKAERTADFTRKLQIFTDNLIEKWPTKNAAPDISFFGQTNSSIKKLQKLEKKYFHSFKINK